MSNLTRIMIVDDHPLMRKGIQQLLSIEPNFHVVAEATNGIEAVSYAKKVYPDLMASFFNRLFTCTFTVPSEICKLSEISLLLRPLATSEIICCSRLVKLANFLDINGVEFKSFSPVI